MLTWLKKMFRGDPGQKAAGGKPRSPKWPEFEKSLIHERGECERCGRKTDLVGHHEIPYHLMPELELDPQNVLIVCMGPLACHFNDHLGNWKSYDPEAHVHNLNYRQTLKHRKF